jgi:hypothetical protein
MEFPTFRTFGAILAAGGLAMAQVALTNEDVVKLARSGLSEAFITDMIEKQPSKLAGEPAKLVELKKAEVPERVITAVSKRAPSQMPVTPEAVRDLASAGFSEGFLLEFLKGNPTQLASLDAARIVELKQAGVSERVLSAMTGKTAEAYQASLVREVPGGTEIAVRMIDSIDSQSAKEGDVFRASLAEDLRVKEEVVAPKGADATVKLVSEKESGKLTGRAELTVELVDVTVNGQKIAVTTTSVSQESGSRGARTAKSAAVVGAVGAVIGGIAGGGRGAAIGAGTGAAAGAGAQVFMKGQRVRIPSETLLFFTTEQALKVPAPMTRK